MTVEEILQQLKDNFNYNDDLLGLLGQIIPAMINYYGEEYTENVVNPLLETPIVICDTREQMVEASKRMGLDVEFVVPSSADAGYEQHFQYNENKEIVRKPLIMINSSRDNEERHEQFIETIIHEMCHMVMNYGKYQIDGNVIHSTTGFIEDEIKEENGVFKEHSKGIAFEEGLNDYDARRIAEALLGRTDIKFTSYGLYVDYVSTIMNNPIIRKAVNQSRLNGDNEWMNLLGEEFSKDFMDSLNDYQHFIFGVHMEDKDEKKRIQDEKFNHLQELYNKAQQMANELNVEENKTRI